VRYYKRDATNADALAAELVALCNAYAEELAVSHATLAHIDAQALSQYFECHCQQGVEDAGQALTQLQENLTLAQNTIYPAAIPKALTAWPNITKQIDRWANQFKASIQRALTSGPSGMGASSQVINNEYHQAPAPVGFAPHDETVKSWPNPSAFAPRVQPTTGASI